MLFPFPVIIKLEVGWLVVVKPLVIAPEITQLETLPVVNAKLVSVPVFALAASVNVV